MDIDQSINRAVFNDLVSKGPLEKVN